MTRRDVRSRAGRTPSDSGPADRTPRDRYIDLLRVFSLSMVVLGHWLAVIVTWEDGTVEGENALNVVPGMWPLTWVFQVMPLFFFVGGFANRKSYESACRRGGGYVAYTTRRLQRLLVPTMVFLAVGLTIATILDLSDATEELLRPAAIVVTVPLWFLGVYLIVLAVAPAMLALHLRFGVWVIVALGGAATAVDGLRFGLDMESIGFFNYGFVWLLVHQLGFMYADSGVERFRGALAGAGAVLLVGLIVLGPYPPNLVGINTEEIDNMNPPTLPILALAGWQVGVALLARPRLTRWLERGRAWASVVALNQRIMTVFLWHMAAILPSIAVIYPLGFPQPEPGSGTFWALRPVWVVLQIPVLLGLVLIFGRFESLGRRFAGEVRAGRESAAGRILAGFGALYAGLGVIGYARLGLEPVYSDQTKDVTVIDVNAARSLIHLLLALFLLRAAAAGENAARRAALPFTVALGALAVVGALNLGLLATTWPETILHAVSALVLFACWLGHWPRLRLARGDDGLKLLTVQGDSDNEPEAEI